MPVSLAVRAADLTLELRGERFQKLFNAGLTSFIQEARLLARFNHPGADPGFSDRRRAGYLPLFQRHTAVVERAHIGCAVLLPEAQHVQQSRMIKAGQQTRFLNKAGEPGIKQLLETLTAQLQALLQSKSTCRCRWQSVPPI